MPRFKQTVFYIAFAVYLITAVRSSGYFHADEHYQIVEFAEYKAGRAMATDLPWEFKEQLRSSIQPSVCYWFMGLLRSFQMEDVYYLLICLRVFSALFALFCIRFFVRNTEGLLKDEYNRGLYSICAYLLWFLPFLSARFSSESWAGLFFILALGNYFKLQSVNEQPINKQPVNKQPVNEQPIAGSDIKIKNWDWLLTGALFGISFLFRFQMAFALMGWGMFILVFRKLNYQAIASIAIGFGVVFILGVALDCWFYKNFVITSWNYFKAVVGSDANSGFGQDAWYYYLQQLVSLPGYLIGGMLLGALLIGIIRNIRTELPWIICSFVALHMLITHKEERFLFPICFLMPLLLMQGFEAVEEGLKKWRLLHNVLQVIVTVALFTNVIGLIAMGYKTAGIGRSALTQYIHTKYGKRPVQLIHTAYANPYNPWGALPEKFYLEARLCDMEVKEPSELIVQLLTPATVCKPTNERPIKKDEEKVKVKEEVQIFTLRQREQAQWEPLLHKAGFKLKIASIPHWIQCLQPFYSAIDLNEVLLLYVRE